MRANTLLRTHRNTPGFETENKSKQVNTSKQRLPDAVVFNPSAFGSFPRKVVVSIFLDLSYPAIPNS